MTDPRAACRVTAGALAAGRVPAALAGLGMVAGVWLARGGPPPATGLALGALLAGFAAHYFAWRTSLDRRLFERCADLLAEDPAGLDATLALLRGGAPPAPPRPLESRIAGARGLLVKLWLFTLVEWGLVAAAAIANGG